MAGPAGGRAGHVPRHPHQAERIAVGATADEDRLSVVVHVPAIRPDAEGGRQPVGDEVGAEIADEPVLVREARRQPGDLLAGLVDGHGNAAAAELVRGHEAREPATDDGDRWSRGVGSWRRPALGPPERGHHQRAAAEPTQHCIESREQRGAHDGPVTEAIGEPRRGAPVLAQAPHRSAPRLGGPDGRHGLHFQAGRVGQAPQALHRAGRAAAAGRRSRPSDGP